MTDDREAFTEARTAGLKQRHEQRLAHAQAVIPEEAVEAAARGLFAEEQCDRTQREKLDENWDGRLDDKDQAEYRDLARAALEAALPHLRGRIGYELGRKETAEAIAIAIEARRDEGMNFPIWDLSKIPTPRQAYDESAAVARDVGKGGPQ